MLENVGDKIRDQNIHGDTLSVDGGQVGVFEEGDKVRLSSFLQSHDGRRLEAKIGLEESR